MLCYVMQKSFNEMQTWISELKQLGPPNIVLAIAGNKSDLEQERRVSVHYLEFHS